MLKSTLQHIIFFLQVNHAQACQKGARTRLLVLAVEAVYAVLRALGTDAHVAHLAPRRGRGASFAALALGKARVRLVLVAQLAVKVGAGVRDERVDARGLDELRRGLWRGLRGRRGLERGRAACWGLEPAAADLRRPRGGASAPARLLDGHLERVGDVGEGRAPARDEGAEGAGVSLPAARTRPQPHRVCHRGTHSLTCSTRRTRDMGHGAGAPGGQQIAVSAPASRRKGVWAHTHTHTRAHARAHMQTRTREGMPLRDQEG